MRKLIFTLALIGVCFYFAKKSAVLSYATTLWSQVTTETKNAVPTRFEIERARHEITSLDGDINGMIRPIAEYMATIGRLKKDIQATQAALDEQKSVLLTMTRDLEGNPKEVVYDGNPYSAERVRQKLHKDFASYQRVEANLKSQKKLLEAKETSLKATQEQLSKLIAKKGEYEVRLAQLEADEETLQIAKIGSTIQIDDSRATQIEAALADIEHRHSVQRHVIELGTGNLANDAIPVQPRQPSPLNVSAIRSYLEGTSATASNK